MKAYLQKELNREKLPEGAKERLLQSANLRVLAMDLGELFGINMPQTAKEVTKTITEKTTKKNETKDGGIEKDV